MSPDRQAAIADLEMVLTNLEALHAKLLADCQEHGAAFTPRQEGKWEGGFIMIRGVLVDELRPMLKAWKEGGAYSRRGEQILGREA